MLEYLNVSAYLLSTLHEEKLSQENEPQKNAIRIFSSEIEKWSNSKSLKID